MATPKKSQKTTKTKTTKSSKTTTKPAKTSTTSAKTTTKSTAKAPVKASATSTTHRTSNHHTAKSHKKKGSVGRTIAIIIGVVALLAVLAAVIFYLCFGKGSMTAKTASGKKVETAYVDFKDGAFRVKIPTDLTALSDSELSEIYGSANRPTTVYTNDKRDLGVVVNLTDNAISDDQIETYLGTMQTLLDVTGNIIDSKTVTTQGHKIGTLELSLASADKSEEGRYDHMAFFSVDGDLVIVTFESSSELSEEYKPVGNFIIDSINFNK